MRIAKRLRTIKGCDRNIFIHPGAQSMGLVSPRLKARIRQGYGGLGVPVTGIAVGGGGGSVAGARVGAAPADVGRTFTSVVAVGVTGTRVGRRVGVSVAVAVGVAVALAVGVAV
jgi:hypothetical protein